MAHSKRSHASRQRRQVCSDLYTSPTSGQTIQAYDSTSITWDASSSCVSSMSSIDLTLYNSAGRAHVWTDISVANGSLAVNFLPSWWNSTTTAALQLQITQSGAASWDTSIPLGPKFNVNWNGTVPDSFQTQSTTFNTSTPTVESVKDPAIGKNSGLSGGKLGAAVALPLLAAVGILCGYLAWSKYKNKGQRKRWSAYVDQRMSQVSTGMNWQDGAPPGARMSMAQSTRSGTPGYAPNRGVSSYYGTEGGYPSGTPSRSFANHAREPSYSSHYPNDSPEAMRKIGHGNRESKISWAADTSMNTSQRSDRSPFANKYASKLGAPSPSRKPPPPDFDSPSMLSDNKISAIPKARLADPYAASPTPSPPSKPLLSKLRPVADSPMPYVGDRASLMSPDDALKRYAETKGRATPPGDPFVDGNYAY